MSLDMTKDVLFIGRGATAICWYRCALPATFMGADWLGIVGEPPEMSFQTGLVQRATQVPDINDYKVVVIQQPNGLKWLTAIKKLQAKGIKVVFEIDDYIHGIRKKIDHDFRKEFNKEHLKGAEMCMRMCDALIVSTEYLAKRYRSFNRNIFVCPNGIDAGRYDLTLPRRGMIGDERATTVGWSGATGHITHVAPWLRALSRVMAQRESVSFVSIGQPLASEFQRVFGEHRGINVPFTLIEQYPAAMTLMDIALAPAGKDAFSRGKSDLRWLEASALGIAVIGDPTLYHEIEDGVTGFFAEEAHEAEPLIQQLVSEPELRAEIGGNARDYVLANRTMDQTVGRWHHTLQMIAAGQGAPTL